MQFGKKAKVELMCLMFEFSRTVNRLTNSPSFFLEEASDAGLFLDGVLVECAPVNRKISTIDQCKCIVADGGVNYTLNTSIVPNPLSLCFFHRSLIGSKVFGKR